MTAQIIKNEQNAGKQIVYAAMEKTVDPAKQAAMKTELEGSAAIPALLKIYLGDGKIAQDPATGCSVGRKTWEGAAYLTF